MGGLGPFLQALEDLKASKQDFDWASTNSSMKSSSKKFSNKKGKKSNKSNGFQPSKDNDKEGSFYCLKHGKNATHDTDDGHVMKKLAASLDKSKSKNKTWTTVQICTNLDHRTDMYRRLHISDLSEDAIAPLKISFALHFSFV